MCSEVSIISTNPHIKFLHTVVCQLILLLWLCLVMIFIVGLYSILDYMHLPMILLYHELFVSILFLHRFLSCHFVLSSCKRYLRCAIFAPIPHKSGCSTLLLCVREIRLHHALDIPWHCIIGHMVLTLFWLYTDHIYLFSFHIVSSVYFRSLGWLSGQL
jgi:hypothetical protein